MNDFHLLCLTDRATDNRTFNVGSGTNHSVLEVYELVTQLLGRRIPPEFKPDLPGEAPATLADIRAAAGLGWKPKTDIREGLVRAIDYIQAELAAGRV